MFSFSQRLQILMCSEQKQSLCLFKPTCAMRLKKLIQSQLEPTDHGNTTVHFHKVFSIRRQSSLIHEDSLLPQTFTFRFIAQFLTISSQNLTNLNESFQSHKQLPIGALLSYALVSWIHGTPGHASQHHSLVCVT